MRRSFSNLAGMMLATVLIGLGMVIWLNPGPKTAAHICRGKQARIRDAAVSYYLEHGLNPNELIDPVSLTNFMAEGRVPHCPGGTNYPPFRIFEGPKCPKHPVKEIPIPQRVAKLSESRK